MKSSVHQNSGPPYNQRAAVDESLDWQSSTRLNLIVTALTIIWVWFSLSAGMADPLDLWHPRASGVTNILNSAAYGNGNWVVVGNEGKLLTSADGVSWKKGNSATTQAHSNTKASGMSSAAPGGRNIVRWRVLVAGWMG